MGSYFGKRAFDLVASCLLLIVFFLPLLALMAAVRIYLGSPIFFRQKRPGLHGKIFEMVKFRSMTDARDANGDLLPDDVRLPRFGRILRATSLDELPELVNVIKGEMSLVGPRPLLPEYLPLYSPEQMRRHEAKPGITGWAQVNGRNAIGWERKFELDVWYVDNASFLLDMKILVMTLQKVIKRGDVSAEGTQTAHKFTGSAPVD